MISALLAISLLGSCASWPLARALPRRSAGWVLAQWVVDGEAPLDLWAVDIRRFADLHRDRRFVLERTLEAYGKHYAIGYPHEEHVSGRPRIVSPLWSAPPREIDPISVKKLPGKVPSQRMIWALVPVFIRIS